MNRHATVIGIGSLGVMIEGPSGSGKSSLALAGIREAVVLGQFAALVADDQCLLTIWHGRLIASCPPALHSKVEMRGLGIVSCFALPAIVVDRVIRLVKPDMIERLPAASTVEIHGVTLPVIDLPERQIAVSLPILMQILAQRRD